MKTQTMLYIQRAMVTSCYILMTVMGSANATLQPETARALTVQFAPYEIIQLIAPVTELSKHTDTAAALRSEYYRKAIPLAQTYGFKNLGQLRVEQTLVGDFKPPAYIIGSWPSAQAFNAFSTLPEWADLKTLRFQAWDELKLFNAEITLPMSLSFREDKFYTVVFAWVDPDYPQDYFTYLDGIEAALNRVGGRFLMKLRNPTLESHQKSELAPQQITFVEWETEDGFQRLSQQADYQAYKQYRDQGVAKIEFHQLSPRFANTE